MLLIMWDIDHTLIETRGTGSQFARAAFQQITGQPQRHHADITGKTEAAIIAQTLRLHGIQPTDEYRRRYAEALAHQYTQHADQLATQGRALPGARDTLAALAQQPDLIQAVLTGNFRQVATIKLDVFGLAAYLDLDASAYGDEHEDRPALVPIAQHHATAKYGQPFTRANTVIIGDSTHDIRAAIDGGAHAIAVTTGKDTADQLRAAGATQVIPDLTNPARLLAAIAQTPRQP